MVQSRAVEDADKKKAAADRNINQHRFIDGLADAAVLVIMYLSGAF